VHLIDDEPEAHVCTKHPKIIMAALTDSYLSAGSWQVLETDF